MQDYFHYSNSKYAHDNKEHCKTADMQPLFIKFIALLLILEYLILIGQLQHHVITLYTTIQKFGVSKTPKLIKVDQKYSKNCNIVKHYYK